MKRDVLTKNEEELILRGQNSGVKEDEKLGKRLREGVEFEVSDGRANLRLLTSLEAITCVK